MENKNTDLNLYGDERVLTKGGHGVDVASQRTDDLDQAAIEFIRINNAPRVLEIGCGLGGQSIRMKEAGAYVTAIDRHDYSASLPLNERLKFIQADFSSFIPSVCYDAIFSQRTIHYLPFNEAVTALKRLVKHHLSPGGLVFLSASGIASELGKGYPHWGRPVEERFAEMAPDMAEKHGIHSPVCLYSKHDMATLLSKCGLESRVWVSPFGNIKAMGRSEK